MRYILSFAALLVSLLGVCGSAWADLVIGTPVGASLELNVNWNTQPASLKVRTLGVTDLAKVPVYVEFTNTGGTRFPVAGEDCWNNWYYMNLDTIQQRKIYDSLSASNLAGRMLMRVVIQKYNVYEGATLYPQRLCMVYSVAY